MNYYYYANEREVFRLVDEVMPSAKDNYKRWNTQNFDGKEWVTRKASLIVWDVLKHFTYIGSTPLPPIEPVSIKEFAFRCIVPPNRLSRQKKYKGEM